MVKFLKDKWPFMIMVVIAIALTFYAYGCEPTTKSLLTPGKQVNRAELESEMEFLLSRSRIGIADLDRQEQMRQLVLEQTFLIAESGAFNPLGLITSILALLGTGAMADDIRLRRQRAKTPYYVKEPEG